MIDLGSGRVACGDLALGPAVRIEQLLALPSVQRVPSVAGTTHLALGMHHCDGRPWGIGAMFTGRQLEKVLLQMLDEDESDWSLQQEEQRQHAHDKFLEQLCSGVSPSVGGARYNFPWGSVESTLDRRGVQALIVVSYKTSGTHLVRQLI